MNPKGRVLLVGSDPALAAEMTPSMTGRDYELATVADAQGAALKLSTEAFSAVVADFARVPPSDRETLVKIHREKGGFALIGVEAAASLSPASPSPLRRLPWPLPKGFLDQVRASEVPILFLVEPSLFLTQGIQKALALAYVRFFLMDSPVGVVEMLRDQIALAEKAKAAPQKTGFWERTLGGKSEEPEGPAPLGRVAVVKFSADLSEAAQIDARVRQALPGAACYVVTTADPMLAAATAVKNGQPALLPREHAVRVAEILAETAGAAKAPAGGKERILIVDIDDINVPTLSRLTETLISLGYDVVTTSDGEDALKKAQATPFALAAIGGSALETTKLSGANLALKLRERDKDLRIILMVDPFPSKDALKGVSRSVTLGFDDALLKPIDAERFVLSIQRALERRRLILENERLFKDLEISERKLAEVNGFQTKFFATVAHDVKNPLTAILGYAEVLALRLKAQPDELKCANHIHNAARTLNLLISDLVDLAAIESGKLRVEIGELDLAAVVGDVKSRVELVAQRKQLQFVVNLPPNLPKLKGDPHRIGQVIQNLCTNAVQYTKEGGKISVEATVQPDWIVIGVRDTGIGISKEDLPRVWERFFQTKEAQTMRKAGFGLGLKIAREIVQMHGGDMGIESELGVGSFFFFKLPVPKPAPVLQTQAPAPSGAPAPVPAPAPSAAPPLPPTA